MGFWIMLGSFILGLTLLVLGFSSKGLPPSSKRSLNKISSLIGIILVGFAIYLAWPK